jgi:hypothetical protein
MIVDSDMDSGTVPIVIPDSKSDSGPLFEVGEMYAGGGGGRLLAYHGSSSGPVGSTFGAAGGGGASTRPLPSAASDLRCDQRAHISLRRFRNAGGCYHVNRPRNRPRRIFMVTYCSDLFPTFDGTVDQSWVLEPGYLYGLSAGATEFWESGRQRSGRRFVRSWWWRRWDTRATWSSFMRTWHPPPRPGHSYKTNHRWLPVESHALLTSL